MKIGFDYTATIGVSGNSTYARELIYNLSKIDKENQYFLYYFFHDFFLGRKPREAENQNFKALPICFSRLKFPLPDGLVRLINRIAIKIFARLNRIEIFHFSDPTLFVRGPHRSVVTLHDLSVLHDNQWARKDTADFYQQNIKNILNQADKIIAVSDFTKKDAVELLNIPEQKIAVVYEGADVRFSPTLDKTYLKKQSNLDNYILYVGALIPRKNIIGLLAAYSQLDPALREKYNLVLVGQAKEKPFAEKIKKIISDLKIDGQVRQFDNITDVDLPKIYSRAKFFIYPSFFEGFGLPVLESLSCGVPVITSRTSSLPEVAGPAGLLINPANTEEIKSAMEKLLLDEQFYQNVKDKCLGQAAKFNWQKTAKETLAVYEKIYQS